MPQVSIFHILCIYKISTERFLLLVSGLTIHSFHGNFFVRSTDLLSLPNINPDAGFGMQISIEENLTDSPYACLQAALLYTSSKGLSPHFIITDFSHRCVIQYTR